MSVNLSAKTVPRGMNVGVITNYFLIEFKAIPLEGIMLSTVKVARAREVICSSGIDAWLNANILSSNCV